MLEETRLAGELVDGLESLRLMLAPLPGAPAVLPLSGHSYRDWALPMNKQYITVRGGGGDEGGGPVS